MVFISCPCCVWRRWPLRDRMTATTMMATIASAPTTASPVVRPSHDVDSAGAGADPTGRLISGPYTADDIALSTSGTVGSLDPDAAGRILPSTITLPARKPQMMMRLAFRLNFFARSVLSALTTLSSKFSKLISSFKEKFDALEAFCTAALSHGGSV